MIFKEEEDFFMARGGFPGGFGGGNMNNLMKQEIGRASCRERV